MVDPAPADVLEALLFASDTPLELDRIAEVLGLAGPAEARALVEELAARLATASRALMITEVAGGYRLVTRREMAPWLVRLARARTRSRLSRPSLETLAIVGYRQPVSRPEIDAIRGVNSEGVLDSLLERRLIRIAGRKDAPGRPFIYETTREFLVAFGLRDISDLPKVAGELMVPTEVNGQQGADVEATERVADARGPGHDEESGADVGTEPAEHGLDEQAQAQQAAGPGGADFTTGR
jgi:segregation and condensation protein B